MDPARPAPTKPPPPTPEALAARRAIAVRAVTALLVPAGGVVAACVLLNLSGRAPIALGLALGHGVAIVLSLSWVLGAILFQDADHKLFLGFTLGQWPFRLAAVVLIFWMATSSLALSIPALFFAFLATHVYGHVVQGLTFSALGRASRPPQEPQSDR